MLALKFFGIVVVGNLIALLLLLVPGINIAAFFLVNGYLLGPGVLRVRGDAVPAGGGGEGPAREACRERCSSPGSSSPAFLAVPLLNLLTPLFAAAMMVHLHKAISARESAPRRASSRLVVVLRKQRLRPRERHAGAGEAERAVAQHLARRVLDHAVGECRELRPQ